MASAVNIAASDPPRPQHAARVVLLLIAMPFIQLGLSYWLSVQVLASMLVLSVALPTAARSVSGPNLLAVAAISSLALLTSALDHNTGAEDVLRMLREQLIFALLAILFPLTGRLAERMPEGCFGTAGAVICGVLALAVAQAILIPARVFPTFPHEWFVANAATLPGALDLAHSDIRPSGPFGEPSYLAFFLVSMLVAMHRVANRPGRRWMFLVIVGGILLSRSAAGYVSLLALGFPMLPARYRPLTLLLAAIAAAVGLALLVVGIQVPVLDRLLNFSGDMSAFARIIAPLALLPEHLVNYPLGVPFRALTDILATSAASLGALPRDVLHNGATNIVLCYGLTGLLLIGVLLWLAPSRLTRVYVGLTMMFNGAFLAPDKLPIVVLALTMSQMVARQPADTAP